MKPKLAVLASGFGSNLQSIIDHIQSGTLKVELTVVISDKENAHALERARIAGVEAVYLPPKQFSDRKAYDQELLRMLRDRNVEWIALAGYMRILRSEFVQAYHRKILNIHPSLLPKYPGMNSIERAFQARETETGVTVHFVDEDVDTGPIILQEKIPVSPADTLELVTERVHEVEHRIYPLALQTVITQHENENL